MKSDDGRWKRIERLRRVWMVSALGVMLVVQNHREKEFRVLSSAWLFFFFLKVVSVAITNRNNYVQEDEMQFTIFSLYKFVYTGYEFIQAETVNCILKKFDWLTAFPASGICPPDTVSITIFFEKEPS